MFRLLRVLNRRCFTAPSVFASGLFALLASGCWGEPPRPDAITPDLGSEVVLRNRPFAELSYPDHSRPGGVHAPEKIPVDGPWRYTGTTRSGMYKYRTEAPIRPRGLFFNQPKPGMGLSLKDGTELTYDRFGSSKRPKWSLDREYVYVYMPTRTPPEETLYLRYDRALIRDAALNFIHQTTTDKREEFVWQSIQDDWDHRRGLLLPAPGTAAWDLTVPEAGELTFLSGLAEPEVKDAAPSDGATLIVELEVNGTSESLGSFPLAIRDFTPRRVDLSKYANQDVRLRFRTEPGETPTFDYAFVAEPVVASRLENPVRVIMVFIDTLRPDHMSLYGYHRDTTKAIDGLASTAVIFDQARSVAPWTLPSARTIVTGRYPDHYLAPSTQTLPGILGDAGFATAFIAGNVYLSANFEMHRDWNLHRVGLWPSATEVTDDAIEWLDEHEGRNALIQVHYMDAHLPYIEPITYRPMYAGTGPAGLRTTFHLSDVRRANLGGDPDGQQYIKDRYDNNVRYATDQVARLVQRLDDNDILLLYADHGEEFWEHGGFEHGHTLFDELLHVPMIIHAPGVKARHVETPVSLLDLTPTILELLGRDIPSNVQGKSLVGVLKGKPDAESEFIARDQAFGLPLYGLERWGVLHGKDKWTTTEGREALYDLAQDPKETNNRLRTPNGDEGKPYREHLANALQRDVNAGYRITPTRARTGGKNVLPTWALCTIEGGLKASWAGNDPLKFGEADVRPIDDHKAMKDKLDTYQILGHELPKNPGRAYEICWSGKAGTREVYLMPNGPLAEVGGTLKCSVYAGNEKGGKRSTLSVPARRAELGKVRTPLSRAALDQRQVILQYGISPLPSDDVVLTDATDDEMAGALTAMGYVQDDYQGSIGGCVPPEVELSRPERFAPKRAEGKTLSEG
ncbi:MAG: sulfatase [Myxococcota bacterium]